MNGVEEKLKLEAELIESNIEAIVENTNTSSLIISIIITIILVIVGGYLMKKHSLVTSNKRSFLICGLQGSGKTNLFHLLTKGKLPVLTVSTLEPSTDEILFNEEYRNQKTFQDVDIVDIPANNKLKNLYLLPYIDENINHIQGIIYLIDSSNFDDKICHNVAENLLEILKITEGKPNGIDILIFANKNDLFTSKKTNKIKEMLEEEIGKLYQLKLRGLSKVNNSLNSKNDDDNDNDNLDLAINDGKFQFDSLDGNVTFAQGNIFKEKYDMINDFIFEKIAN